MPDIKLSDDQRQLLIVFVMERYVRVNSLNPGFERETAECCELLKLLQGTDTVLISRKLGN